MGNMFIRGTTTRNLRALVLGTVAASALLTAGAAVAQPGLEVADPPELKRRGASPNHPFDPASKEILLDLNIEYTDGVIYNPTTGVDDKVRLRSYTGPGQPQTERFISPSIIARPGDTVRIKLNNKLPPTTTSYDTGCAGGPGHDVNHPHCFNGTNLHFHGLNVNPSGNGDNVLLSINPGVQFEYEIAISPEHPAGTFWYHTHRHGSTALQVSSGMAGALIVRGDRVPTATKNGDLDVLLNGVRNLKERTLMFQQIQYGCFDSDQNIKIKTTPAPGFPGGARIVAWTCDAGDVGGIETFEDNRPAPFGPSGFRFGTWGQSNRYTSINGLILPTFRTKQNVVERWRMIHGGVRDTIRLIFVKATAPPDLRPGKHLEGEEMDKVIDSVCGRATTPYYVVAQDGLTMGQAVSTRQVTMQPGYRYDALVSFPEEGDYCVIDALAQAAGNDGIGGVPRGARLLGIVKVERDQAQVNRGTLAEQLVDSAEKTMPAGEIRDAVIADLNNGLRLSRFAPHQTIADSELTGGQEMTFDIKTNVFPNLYQVANQLPTSPGYNPEAYKPDRLDRKLTLGTAEEWKLSSAQSAHPFHIHVNPFQIVKIVNDRFPTFDLSLPGASDFGDPQYIGLKGVWKDTIWVKPGYTLTVRTRYERYIGEFVLHCHILDHEDQGMMQNVAIVLPGGGTTASVNAAPADPHGIH
jgi:FtsP/CotA-like multicopper oxidase with cupredoxin domain